MNTPITTLITFVRKDKQALSCLVKAPRINPTVISDITKLAIETYCQYQCLLGAIGSFESLQNMNGSQWNDLLQTIPSEWLTQFSIQMVSPAANTYETIMLD